MNFIDFRNKFFDFGIFSNNQVYSWRKNFDRNNLSRWIKKGLIIRLRQGLYTFIEYKSEPNFSLYAANRIYCPSYISLHSALSYYGLIPEAVVQIISVSTLKTASFNNDLGNFNYRTINKMMMFGYDRQKFDNERTFLIAQPAKAIVDLFYLYPEYNTEKEILELRFDEDIITEIVDKNLLLEYTKKTQNKSLMQRIEKLIGIYGL